MEVQLYEVVAARHQQAVAGDVLLYVVVYDVLVEVLALEQKLSVVLEFHG